jgi:uncharacterized membrane protein
MSFYEFLLFVHVVGAIVWIGSGFLLIVMSTMADRARDEVLFGKIFTAMGQLGNRLFVPASLTVLLAGIVLVVDGPWGFGELWILLSLAGYAATFLMGVLVFEPAGKRIGAALERDGEMKPATLNQARRVLLLSRIDYSVLFMVVATMVIKPTGSDGLVLAAMAAVIGVTAYVSVARARELSGGPPGTPAPAGA